MRTKTNRVRCLLSVLFLSVLWCAVATGKIIYVDGDAPGAHDGSSWACAYQCLQDAIAEVRSGNEIRVAQGIYHPDRRTIYRGERTGSGREELTASGSRTATFELINDVTFKGGYAGYGEPDPDARDIHLYETVLSGDLAGNDADDPEDRWYRSSRAENSFNVLTASGTAVLDGFTVTGGEADALHHPGGGLYNQYGTMRIINCLFRGNSSQSNGGAIYNYRGNPSLVNCTFIGNSANDDGGGVYNHQGNPTLFHCTFLRNSSQRGGGMYNGESHADLIHCLFRENLAFHGGGMYNDRSSSILTKCTFSGNVARDYGGGVCNIRSDPILTNCIFTANQGDLYGAGMSCHNSDSILTNCTFTGNVAPMGSALAFNEGQSIARIDNCILWDGSNAIWDNDRSIITISYSNIQGNWNGRFGEGNIDADPLFVNPEGPDDILGTGDDELGLALLSPCVDMGDPNFAPLPSETDADNNTRVVGGRVDMGAYEFQGVLYVDDDTSENPEAMNPLKYGTEDYPFNAIQEAIDTAREGYTILVRPGVYNKIDFLGKPITVQGVDGAAVIEASLTAGRIGGEDAVTFHTGEGPGSVLKNFIIRNSGMAISLNLQSSPTISNLTIVDNDFGIAAYENSTPDICNCIFWNNKDGNLFQCEVRYSCVDGGAPGEGNISVDPLFVDASDGDYHLKSEGWRWSRYTETWTYDDVTSRCIDAGDPDSPLGDELMSVPRDDDNEYGINRRINMGAFGGTFQASMAPTHWTFPEYETTPPEPNPAQWAPDGAPREVPGEGLFGYYAQMTVVEAADASGWGEYFFECTTESGFSSDWQSSPTYSVWIGRGGQGQRFRVKARDLYANETAWSEELPAN